ncbi:geranylgeranylglyceryl/heptaprenylglyceryl phosphate synthase [Lacihabitans sp. LS3-19]|uniref:geranylgeranylglyceryl/heptaprenylglyceryl phosphate synthase n=1 Tax=Lacihabitans sp. LS3-19 TaxID=2487335 RepID=UPI0020CDDA0B|nr:geranylgeranylglyceryl/heptaprenylglyceryl phosphate synthase [Lacihabitans sp. LS3-19]MCP9768504.1 geranylgeranylglyceryl/heptaprenylglyceryl phosphate synthase [Lacihabitans sp. LS3-19]
MRKILSSLYSNVKAGKKSFAVLLDPDKLNPESLEDRINAINSASVDYIFVGGSLISTDNMNLVLEKLQEKTFVPKVIFPGNGLHINESADGILLLSLISGRNPDFLIGQHVISAPILKRSSLETLPTGYILIDGGKPTTVSYISNTFPIPNNKPDVAAATAIAGEMLGLKLIYLDAGSGAQIPVSEGIIQTVKKNIEIPLIVGGGINTVQKASKALAAGADVIVIGNAIEDQPGFLHEISQLVESYNLSEA